MKTEQPSLSRGEFLRSLGLSTSALMAFYCLGTSLTACSTGEVDPAPMNPTSPGGTTGGGSAPAGVTGTTTGANIDFTLDLTSSNFSKLKNEGEFVIVGDALVAKAVGNRYVALSKICTHAGSTVQYRRNQNDIWCSAHGSVFNLDGSVRSSPATSPLRQFQTVLSQDGNSLRVRV